MAATTAQYVSAERKRIFRPSITDITDLQRDVNRIRNVCILAHVDHGKTTLADYIVASNCLISSRLAGKLRFLDSRPDEQERGITMKSSAIALMYKNESSSNAHQSNNDFLVNLIDSPGHVDFASEVSTAVRLCDGALVVVDAVEGVQSQTKTVLSQAFKEGIRLVLVINKLDRLIFERKMDTSTAFFHLMHIVEQCNAILGELFTKNVLELNGGGGSDTSEDHDLLQGWQSGLNTADDSNVYFCPEKGNVVFASAYDGWAFDLLTFAKIYSSKFLLSESKLLNVLWSPDHYLSKDGVKLRISEGALKKGKKPIFVQIVLDNIWSLCQHSQNEHDGNNYTKDEMSDEEKLEKIDKILSIAKSLQVKLAVTESADKCVNERRKLRTNLNQLINVVLSSWLPLDKCVMRVICEHLPSPNDLSGARIRSLYGLSHSSPIPSLPTKKDGDDTIIVSIAKMIAYPASHFNDSRQQREADDGEGSKYTFVGLARILSGQIKTDGSTEVYVVGPNVNRKRVSDKIDEIIEKNKDCPYPNAVDKMLEALPKTVFDEVTIDNIDDDRLDCDTASSDDSSCLRIFKTNLSQLFLLLGKDLQKITSDMTPYIGVGNIIGIRGLENFVLKSASLTNNMQELLKENYLSNSSSSADDSVVMKVVIETVNPSDLNVLKRGLHLLNQADPNVQVGMTSRGEYVLITAGEVHLERCIRDLNDTYAIGVELSVSEPKIPFQETLINETSRSAHIFECANGRFIVEMNVQSLPSEFVDCLERVKQQIKTSTSVDENRHLKNLLAKICDSQQMESGFVDNICCFGPKRCGTNILLDESGCLKKFWSSESNADASTSTALKYQSCIEQGFQMATGAGPLCEEPMRGLVFSIKSVDVNDEKSDRLDSEMTRGSVSGQIISCVNSACRQLFSSCFSNQRLVLAMYAFKIQVKVEALGKLYSVIGKRPGGRIGDQFMIEGSSTFEVTAYIPIVESQGLINDIRRHTSGLATMPQLQFDHWSVLQDSDPNIDPSELNSDFKNNGDDSKDDECDEYDSLRARNYKNAIRRSKGLFVDEHLVEFGEKQRNLTRNK